MNEQERGGSNIPFQKREQEKGNLRKNETHWELWSSEIAGRTYLKFKKSNLLLDFRKNGNR